MNRNLSGDQFGAEEKTRRTMYHLTDSEDFTPDPERELYLTENSLPMYKIWRSRRNFVAEFDVTDAVEGEDFEQINAPNRSEYRFNDPSKARLTKVRPWQDEDWEMRGR